MTPRSISFLASVSLIGLVCATPGQGSSLALPSGFTVLQGDYDAVLVSEFALGNGCADIQVDSIARRSPAAGVGGGLSSSATLYWTAFEPKLDSASAAACQSVRRLRRTDPIPRIEYYPVISGGTSTFFPVVLRVDPDSVFECRDGSCSHVSTGIVHNVPDPSTCVIGAIAPLPSADSALSWLRGRLASAPSIYLLQRPPYVTLRQQCAIYVDDTSVAAPRAFAGGFTFQETRLQYVADSWTPGGRLPIVGDRWADTAISNDLALPLSANAGDYFSPETLHLYVQALRAPAPADPPTTFAYPTGIKTYQYRGWDSTWTCPDGVWNRRASLIGDSLKLEGPSVRLSNDGCARPGIDVFADKYDRWLFAPSGTGSLVDEFRHGSSLGYGNSWPISDDTVWVAGRGVPLTRVLAATSILPSAPRPSLHAAVRSGVLELDLPFAASVVLVTPAGRRVESREFPAGHAALALGGYRGLLLVRAGLQQARILAP
jgi:hypothetical protein